MQVDLRSLFRVFVCVCAVVFVKCAEGSKSATCTIGYKYVGNIGKGHCCKRDKDCRASTAVFGAEDKHDIEGQLGWAERFSLCCV